MEVKRFIFSKLSSEFSEPFISILIGARQVGKTTLLRALEKMCAQKGLKTRFFDMELSSDLEFFSKPQHELMAQLKHCGDVIFIDEFHYIPNAFKLFTAIYDSKQTTKLYASVSYSI